MNGVRSEALPTLQAKLVEAREYDCRLRDEYGVHVNYVSPVQWQGRKLWAIGNRVYPGRPPNETFHEFILSMLRETLGEDWRAGQAALPEAERHFVLKCFEHLAVFKQTHADRVMVTREGQQSAVPNGWVQYVISLAWDVATLINAGGPPPELVNRLRDRVQFQGARYEIAIAAIFARLDCNIVWLDEKSEYRGVKHVEFEATHRPSGQSFAVEAKSRHRPGVLNQPGEPDLGDPLKTDARMVRQLFMRAVEKAPTHLPYLIFVDINAPVDTTIDKRWQADVQRWTNRLPESKAERPDVFNAAYITNFSPHYDGDDVSCGGSWLVAQPAHVRQPLTHDFQPALMRALDKYGRVPAFAEDGTLTD